MTCPDCQGTKIVQAHLQTSRGCKWRELPCFTCDGTGSISEKHVARIAEGKQRREDRLSRGMTLRREAERLGISATELSRIESGRSQGD